MIRDTDVRPTPIHPGDPSNGSAAHYAEEYLPLEMLEAESAGAEEGKLPLHA